MFCDGCRYYCIQSTLKFWDKRNRVRIKCEHYDEYIKNIPDTVRLDCKYYKRKKD